MKEAMKKVASPCGDIVTERDNAFALAHIFAKYLRSNLGVEPLHENTLYFRVNKFQCYKILCHF